MSDPENDNGHENIDHIDDALPANGSPQRGGAPGYRVGYGKPPVETRFKKGQPQNFRRGRKRKQSDQGTLARLANEQISITENGKRRKISAQEAILLRLRNDALNGDRKAQDLWLKHCAKPLDKTEELDRLRSVEEHYDGQWVREKIDAMAARWEAEQSKKKADEEK